MRKPKVAFICVHNSCRSQIAEALGKHLASDVFESYSAGTEVKPKIEKGGATSQQAFCVSLSLICLPNSHSSSPASPPGLPQLSCQLLRQGHRPE